MSTCPICHAPTTPDMHNCAYCGVSLIDRKHKAPSQAPPALLTRPVSQQNPLSLETTATPASELSTMNLTMDSMDESGGPLTVDLSGSEEDALVIETPVPDLVVLDPDKITPRITSDNQDVYVPTTIKNDQLLPTKANRFSEPRLATIDEASDGLGPLDVDIDEQHIDFPNEPLMSHSRPQAKLSDLSGRYALSGTEHQVVEPGFDLQSSALSQAVSSSVHQSSHPGFMPTEKSNLSPRSSFVFLGQALLFTTLTLAVLGALGIGDSLLELPSWLHYQQKDLSSQVDTDKHESPRQGKVSQPIQFLDDQGTEPQLTPKPSPLSDKMTVGTDHRSPKTVSSSKPKSQAPTAKVKNNSNTASTQVSSKVSTKAKSKSVPKKRKLSYNSLIKQGETLLMRGRVGQAESLFKKAQKLNPSNAEALAQLAWCQLARKKTKSAITKFKQALSRNPVHGDSLYGLGYSYEKLNESKQAIHFFELYLRRYPKGKKVGVIKNKMRRLKR